RLFSSHGPAPTQLHPLSLHDALPIYGKRVKINHPGDAMRLGIAYVPEERGSQGLIRQMTVQENLTLAVLRSLTQGPFVDRNAEKDRKSTRLNSSHVKISYAVFCLKKK